MYGDYHIKKTPFHSPSPYLLVLVFLLVSLPDVPWDSHYEFLAYSVWYYQED